MTVKYLDSKRISGLSSDIVDTATYETDFSSNTGWTTSNSSKVDIDTSANELQIKENGGSLAQMYYDLGASVSATKWVIRCRILVNGSANTDEVLFKFELNDTANASSNTNSDALGFYVYTDRNNTWSRIYQVCKDNTTSVQGLSATPAYYGNISNSTYYYITLTRSSATDFEVKIRTGSHSGTVLGTLTQSSIPSGLTGLRYLTAQNYLQGQGQTMDISNLEFYNGVSSLSSKPTNVQDNSILVEKDTGKRYWRSGEVSGSDTNTTQTTYNDISGIGNFDGGWGLRINAGHALVGQEIRSIKVRMRSTGTVNTTNMTARLYGSTKATLRATSTAISSSGLPSSFTDYTFVFPSGSRGVVQAGDHLLIVADALVASGSWNCQIKSSAGTNTHFTTWQQQTNAFTEQTSRELWYDPIVSGTFTPATWIGNFDLSDLKAYYKFDESSGNIINQATSVGSSDSLGSNADMTISGATYSQTGKIGNALSFDGSNDYGTLGSSLSQWNLFHGTGDWSINFWVNYDEFVAESRFFSNMDSTETRGINLGVGWSGNPDGQIGLSIKSNGGFMTNNGGINFPSDISGTGTWVMITLVADYSDTTNTYTVYLNGVAGSSVARAVAGSTGDSEYSLKLASRGNYADRFFDGLFDEMTIWSRVLTADEITSLYNANIGKIVY